MYVEKRFIPEPVSGVKIVGDSKIDTGKMYLKNVPVVVDVAVVVGSWWEK